MPRHPPCALSRLTSRSIALELLFWIFRFAFRTLCFHINLVCFSDVLNSQLVHHSNKLRFFSCIGQSSNHHSHYFHYTSKLVNEIILVYCTRCFHQYISVWNFQGTNANSFIGKWRRWDSNSWPPACKAGALPTELRPHWAFRRMGLNGLEPSTSRLSGVRSNQLSYKPI